jgi:putative transcriptional regulator
VDVHIGYTGPVRVLPETTVLRGRRYLEGLAQAELAAAVGASRATISSLERGLSTPSLALACALARQLDLPVEELFPESDRR